MGIFKIYMQRAAENVQDETSRPLKSQAIGTSVSVAGAADCSGPLFSPSFSPFFLIEEGLGSKNLFCERFDLYPDPFGHFG